MNGNTMLSKKARNRITRDVKTLQMVPLISEGIYIIPDDDDITLVRAMIIGPDDTPYENGMYFYEIRFPDNYPYSPPKVVYLTNDGNTRMHPNFYSCGKVCVSIIGTWSGPGWTSCQSLSSILLTFRSLLIKNPLWQEPGFTDEKTQRNTDYNKLISYENMRIAVLKMTSNTPTGFGVFKDIMIEHLKNNKDKIMEFCQSRLDVKGPVNSPQIYCFSKDIDYEKLTIDLEKMYQNLETQYYDGLITTILDKINSNEGSIISYRKLLDEVTTPFEDTYLTFDNVLSITEMRGLIKRTPKGEISLSQD